MTGRETFTVETPAGSLAGWVGGSGPRVLLLHGGPGLSFEYLDELAAELGPGFCVAAYQQRGLEPSTLDGPFTIAQAVDDAIAVLDGLGWDRALVIGHSWGGQLALRLAAGRPDRVLGSLAIDPVGVVGDGGIGGFEAEIVARTPKARRRRARDLDELAMSGRGTPEQALESLRIVWGSYFANPENVPPMPWGQAARATVELSPNGFLKVVPGAGHFPWFEQPGCVRAALARLIPASAAA